MNWRETKYSLAERRRLCLYDDFNRADTVEPDLGTAVRGGKWIIADEKGVAPGRYGCIRSGCATTSRPTRDGQFVFVNQRGLGAIPTVLFATIRWVSVPDGQSYSGWLSMGCTNEANSWSGANGLHIAVRRSRCQIRARKEDIEMLRKEVALDPQLSIGTNYIVIAEINMASGAVAVSINGVDVLKVRTNLLGKVVGTSSYWQACYDSFLKSTAELTFKEVGASIDPAQPPLVRQRDDRWRISV